MKNTLRLIVSAVIVVGVISIVSLYTALRAGADKQTPAGEKGDTGANWSVSDGVLTAVDTPGNITSSYLGRDVLVGGKFEVRTTGGFRPQLNYFIDADPNAPITVMLR